MMTQQELEHAKSLTPEEFKAYRKSLGRGISFNDMLQLGWIKMELHDSTGKKIS